jgi:chromosome segregation ATPase
MEFRDSIISSTSDIQLEGPPPNLPVPIKPSIAQPTRREVAERNGAPGKKDSPDFRLSTVLPFGLRKKDSTGVGREYSEPSPNYQQDNKMSMVSSASKMTPSQSYSRRDSIETASDASGEDLPPPPPLLMPASKVEPPRIVRNLSSKELPPEPPADLSRMPNLRSRFDDDTPSNYATIKDRDRFISSTPGDGDRRTKPTSRDQDAVGPSYPLTNAERGPQGVPSYPEKSKWRTKQDIERGMGNQLTSPMDVPSPKKEFANAHDATLRDGTDFRSFQKQNNTDTPSPASNGMSEILVRKEFKQAMESSELFRLLEPVDVERYRRELRLLRQKIESQNRTVSEERLVKERVGKLKKNYAEDDPKMHNLKEKLVLATEKLEAVISELLRLTKRSGDLECRLSQHIGALLRKAIKDIEDYYKNAQSSDSGPAQKDASAIQELEGKNKLIVMLEEKVRRIQTQLEDHNDQMLSKDRQITALRIELEEKTNRLEFLEARTGSPLSSSKSRPRDRNDKDMYSDSAVETFDEGRSDVFSPSGSATGVSPAQFRLLREQLAAANHKIASLENDATNFRNSPVVNSVPKQEYAALESKLLGLEDQLAISAERRAEAEAKSDRFQRELEEVKSGLQDSRQELRNNAKSMESQLRQEVDELRNRARVVGQKLDESEKQRIDLEFELKSLKLADGRSQDRISALQDEMKRQKEEFLHRIMQLQEEKSQLEGQHANQRSDASSKTRDMENELRERNQDISRLESELRRYQAQAEKAELEVRDLQLKSREEELERARVKQECDRLKRECDEANSAVMEKVDRVKRRYEEENQTLIRDLDDSKRDIGQLEQQLLRIQTERDELDKVHDSEMQQLQSSLQGRLEDVKDELEEKSKQFDRLQVTLERMQAEFEDERKEFDERHARKLQQLTADLEAANQLVDQEVAEKKKKVREIEEKYTELQHRYEDDMSAYERELSSIQNSADSQISQMEDSKRQVTALEKEKLMLKEQLSVMVEQRESESLKFEDQIQALRQKLGDAEGIDFEKHRQLQEQVIAMELQLTQTFEKFTKREDELSSELEMFQLREQKAETEYSDLQRQLDLWVMNFTDYDSERKKLEKVIETQREEMTQLKSKLEDSLVDKVGDNESNPSVISLRKEFRRILAEIREEYQGSLNKEIENKAELERNVRALKRDRDMEAFHKKVAATQTLALYTQPKVSQN